MNVTNVTIALYALATRHNNGVVPNTQRSLDVATAGVRSGELVQMAAIINLVADVGTGISLPTGRALQSAQGTKLVIAEAERDVDLRVRANQCRQWLQPVPHQSL